MSTVTSPERSANTVPATFSFDKVFHWKRLPMGASFGRPALAGPEPFPPAFPGPGGAAPFPAPLAFAASGGGAPFPPAFPPFFGACGDSCGSPASFGASWGEALAEGAGGALPLPGPLAFPADGGPVPVSGAVGAGAGVPPPVPIDCLPTDSARSRSLPGDAGDFDGGAGTAETSKGGACSDWTVPPFGTGSPTMCSMWLDGIVAASPTCLPAPLVPLLTAASSSSIRARGTTDWSTLRTSAW
mmetsp:Transcript_123252/g.349242  ORF Transcript_123252/g.349242 Transcript_123252/m.349242 type:complete len:243 (-) Transcript_123252:712-1440(-)